MANPLYLAMTEAEFLSCEEKPQHIAWMACHFSPYSQGISNIPQELPEGSILMLNDRIEPTIHDVSLVAMELAKTAEKYCCSSVILDFQRPGIDLTEHMIQPIISALPCPAAVSHHYAKGLDCGVLLPLPPVRCNLLSYLAQWKDREIWLDVYDRWEQVRITDSMTEISEERPAAVPLLPHFDESSICRYRLDIMQDCAVFTLHRGIDEIQTIDLPQLHLIGLWQEYRSIQPT